MSARAGELRINLPWINAIFESRCCRRAGSQIRFLRPGIDSCSWSNQYPLLQDTLPTRSSPEVECRCRIHTSYYRVSVQVLSPPPSSGETESTLARPKRPSKTPESSSLLSKFLIIISFFALSETPLLAWTMSHHARGKYEVLSAPVNKVRWV